MRHLVLQICWTFGSIHLWGILWPVNPLQPLALGGEQILIVWQVVWGFVSFDSSSNGFVNNLKCIRYLIIALVSNANRYFVFLLFFSIKANIDSVSCKTPNLSNCDCIYFPDCHELVQLLKDDNRSPIETAYLQRVWQEKWHECIVCYHYQVNKLLPDTKQCGSGTHIDEYSWLTLMGYEYRRLK